MRADRLIIWIAALVLLGCKTTQPSKPAPIYDEDLRIHRPPLASKFTTDEVKVEQTGTLTGHIKTELDGISELIIQENAKPRTEQGYSIQIYSGSNREEANMALGRIRIVFPEMDAQLIYFQPDFKVKVGQYTDRLEAYQAFEKVRVEFVDALLIPEKVKINYD